MNQTETPQKASEHGQERRSFPDSNRYFNQQFDADPNYIKPGEIVCNNDKKQMYVATVGSGVLITMHDVELKIGAMAYVLVGPELMASFPHFEKESKWRDLAISPVEKCITQMKKLGAGKHRLQIRLIGGAKMPARVEDDAGTKNYIFVREYLSRKGLSIFNEDLGGPYVRRAHFFPETGRAVRMILRRAADFALVSDLEKTNSA